MQQYVAYKIDQLDVYPSYKGGRTMLHSQGYIYEFAPEHHLANSWGWVAQHRLIGEDIAGRPLVRSKDSSVAECVHHIDEVRLNNDPSNLEIMTVRAHRTHHARIAAEKQKSRLTSEMVKKALDGRTIKGAAAHLHCDHNTLRNRFPELIADRKRISPSFADDPETWERIKPYALSDKFAMKEAVKILKISARTMLKCCRLHGVEWVHKKRSGRPPKKQADGGS